MSKRAVIYARVSTEEQGKGYSLATQIDSCQSYADQRGYRVVAQFQDMYTGTQLDRPGLNELYRFVEDRTADVVVVHDLDRLSREVANQAIIEMELSRSGLKVEYVLGQYADNPEGELLKLVKSGIAQYENRQRVERSRRGKKGRVEAGYVLMPTARAPYGYDYVAEKHKGWLVINEQQATVVRMMYDWLVVDGLSSYAIARKLWELGIQSKGDVSSVVYKKDKPAAWSPATVRKVISNSVYKGLWYYGKKRREKVGGKVVQRSTPQSEWIAVQVPAVVSEEMWQRAQQCLKENKENSPRKTKREYLLRGMVFCPCGRRWVGVCKRPDNRVYLYYSCPANEAELWRKRCENRFGIRAETLEEAVWDKIASFILEPGKLKREVQRRRAQAAQETERLTRRLEAIGAAIAEVDRKVGILLDEVLTGGFSRAVIDAKKRELDEQRVGLGAEAERIMEELEVFSISAEQEAAIDRFAEEVRDSLGEQTFRTKRRILELMRLRVDVISRTQVKLTGIISSEGLFMELSSA